MIRRVKKASNNDATGDSYESKSSLVGPTKSTANQNLALWLAKITTWFVFWFLLAILVTYLIDGPVIFKTVREASRSDATTATLWYIIGIHLIVLHSILMVMIFRWRRLNDFVGLRHELIAMQAVISVFWLVDAGIMLGLPSIYTRVAIFADLAAMGFHTIVIFTIPLFRVLQHRKRERRHAMLIMPETQIHDFNMDASTTTKSTTTFQSLPARQSAKPLEPSPETVGPLFQTNMAKNRPGGRGSIVPVKTEEDLERLWSSTASGKSKIINIARKYFALENCLLLSDIDDIILSATWEAHPVASNHDVDDQGEGGNTESQSAAVRLATMIHLFTKYIAPDSPYEVNIPKTLKDDFRDCINDQKKPSLPVIYEIRKHIFTLLYTNFKHLFNEVVEPKEAVEMRRQTMSNHPTPQSLRHSRSPPVIAHSKMSTTFYNC
ncbi:hypothetical protein HK102_005612 [Quaeritorhiza haematococci]|nr:hypothetical protein HK102_005612 [Quaeritorhiza haematococci]